MKLFSGFSVPFLKLFIKNPAGIIPDGNKGFVLTCVSFSSCQRNLIKTFQIEAMIALITKMAMIFS